MDIVVLAFTDKWWDWARTGFESRTAALTCALAAEERVHRVLVVDTPTCGMVARLRGHRGARPASADDTVARPTMAKYPFTQVQEKVFVLDHARLLPRERHVPSALRVNGLLHDRSLAAAIRRVQSILGMASPAVIHAGPLTTALMGCLGEGLCVYDAVDEWLAHPAFVSMAPTIRGAYDRIRERADLVTAVSPALAAAFHGGKAAVRLLPNGCGDEYLHEVPAFSTETVASSRPVVGYVGAMQERFDAHLMEQVATAMPDASFCLVGPVLSPAHFERLTRLSNVHFLGRMNHSELHRYVRGFDVCVMPHIDSALTRSMDPIKIYEYVAAGKPTVATGLPQAERFAGYVRVHQRAAISNRA
jgi:glycosyltransferase involved in cell wall biosynthesis